MNIADKLTAIAENMQNVYEAGKEKAISDFWDSAQDGITTSRYMFAGNAWTDITFNPKKDIIVKESGALLFAWSRIVDLKGILERNGVSLIFDPSSSPLGKLSLASMFNSSKCENIPDIDLRDIAVTSAITGTMFANSNVKNVKLIVDEDVMFNINMFHSALLLQNIIFEGDISNSIYFPYSALLSMESCKNIITNLKDYSGTDKEFSCELALTDEVIEMIKNDYTAPGGISWYDYATNKGWNI